LNLKNIDRRLITILLIIFMQMMGAAMILPILPLYAQREFALSPQFITLLSTSYFAAQFLAGPFLGRLSDKYGRIPILIVSQIGTAVSFVMLAAAGTPEMLFLARVLDGITGGNIIVAQAYVTDVVPRERRTEALGYTFAVFGAGFVLGPALGGLLSAALGPRMPYILAAIAASGLVVLTWRILEETVTPEQRLANRQKRQTGLNPAAVVRNRSLLLILLVAFVAQFGLGLMQSTFALYGEAVFFRGRSQEATTLGVGLLLAAFGLGQFTTQALLLRPALRRFGEYRLIIFGDTLRFLGLFGYALITSPWLAAVGSICFAFGTGVMMPSLQSVSTRTVADEVRGGVLGLYQSTLSLSIIISSAIAGVLFAIDPQLPYWLGGSLGVVALLPAVLLWQREGQPRPAVEKQVATGP
jgi:DHA1 family tetracycline resistance protein-like MFS transporter